jgi:hypothetical protein
MLGKMGLYARAAKKRQIANENMVEPKQISENLFVGQQKNDNGESIYFRMELLTKENVAYWRQYVDQSYCMANTRGRGLLTYIAMHIQQVDTSGITRYYFDEPYDNKLKERVGFTEEEFQYFVMLFGKQGFTKNNINKRKILESNSLGSSHICMSESGSQYIVYACKNPEFSILSTKLVTTGKLLSLKEYMEQYSNILMCVGSDLSGESHYHNRGIFRNPCNVLENTYKGIAMLLHGFSAAVVKKYFKNKSEMLVRPVSSMQYLICNTLNPDDFFIDGKSWSEVLEDSKKVFDHPSDGNEYPINHIKVDALTRYFYLPDKKLIHQHKKLKRIVNGP